MIQREDRQRYLKSMGIDHWVLRRNLDEPERAGEAAADEPAAVTHETPAAGNPATNDSAAVSGVVADALNWPQLRAAVAACQACGLHSSRTQTVFGVGRPDADLLIIGEAPGADEDRQGEPFVGRAGQLLNAMLAALGLSRDAVFIANILKCRPPQNRDPRPDEATACTPFLERQIALIQPRVILAVGRVPAQWLLATETAVGRLRGTVHEFGQSQTPLIVTYHPAYLLRSPLAKAKSWQDLLLVREILT